MQCIYFFHGFGSHGWICAGISPKPYKLWTWHLHHWIQQRLRFKRMCRNIVTTPLDLELWTRQVSHVSWIWFGWVVSWCHISRTWKTYGHETCTIGYSKDWSLERCVEILWQPHTICSYEPVNSTRFMDLVWVGQFVVPYLLNPITYGYETVCTIG